MELRQLIYFEAVARLGSFTKAAAQLHIAQPAVSAQVRKLEQELGATLLERTTRQVRLTQAGELVMRRAGAVRAQIAGVHSDLSDLSEVVSGQLRIGATTVLGALDLPDLLAGFHRHYGGVELAVQNGLVSELLAALDDGLVDVILGPIHEDLADRYAITTLAAETLVLITSPGLLPSTGRPIRLRELHDHSFACLQPTSGLRQILTAAAAQESFVPRVQFEAASPAGIIEFVGAGLGVALIAASAVDRSTSVVDVHALTNSPAHPPIGIIALRSRRTTPTVRAWSAYLKQTLAISAIQRSLDDDRSRPMTDLGT